ncbi:MAG: IMP cyclohydrolase [Methanonatronarchaeales archaeon]|nr:IMP cyclohydrolase [Methanonatronarchaeales archaeon]
MYVGRFVVAGVSPGGRPFGAYRVSSRSFPDRRAVETERGISVVPRSGHGEDVFRNPYVSYNCVRIAGDTAVLANGSHTDPAAEKIGMGYPPRDALALSLLSLDYEKDEYDTPRVAAAVSRGSVYLGIARRDAVIVREFEGSHGEAAMVATYGRNDLPGDVYEMEVESAAEAAEALFEEPLDFEHPVCGAATMLGDGGWESATVNP